MAKKGDTQQIKNILEKAGKLNLSSNVNNILEKAGKLNLSSNVNNIIDNNPTQEQQKIGNDFLQHLLGSIKTKSKINNIFT